MISYIEEYNMFAERINFGMATWRDVLYTIALSARDSRQPSSTLKDP